LNGVHQPFWRNWGNADLSIFLTPDALHAWHKFFFNHPLKWIINIMGSEELDCCMAALQQCVGMCHWAHGISKLKQVTGHEHRDLEKILVAVAAGGVQLQTAKACMSHISADEHTITLYTYFVVFDDLQYLCNLWQHYTTQTI